MNLEEFRSFCLQFEGVSEEMKWGYLCFMVENKIFVIIDVENEHRFSTKCSMEEFEELTEIEGVEQAPHFAKRQWVSVANLNVLSPSDLKKRISTSRNLVIAKLPKKLQQKYM
ncbi:MAG: MmcQ/YjbR family DNA-binding protein [Sphingobacteriaceae bacterium]|nr:MmcQ/YjbR family DNA-binding protein [Sphingobacteriaceae bacterium]